MINKILGSRENKKTIQLSILALPAILVIFVFSYIPMAGIFLAFKNINYEDGIFHSPWVGFDNFKFFFTSSDAWLVVRNTLGYNIVFIVVGTALSVLFAILLNEVISRRSLKVYQTIFFFPYFFSWIIVAYMVYSFIGPYGIISNLIRKMGFTSFDFYIDDLDLAHPSDARPYLEGDRLRQHYFLCGHNGHFPRVF